MSGVDVIPLQPGSVNFLPFRPSFHLPLRFTVNTTYPTQTAQSTPCRLHFDVSVPDAVFFDRDELRDALHSFDWTLEPTNIDIERAIKPSAPISHLHLTTRDEFWGGERPNSDGEEKKVKIPMHARYLSPNEDGRETVWLFSGGQSGEVRGGWVCGAESSNTGTIDLPVINTLPLPLLLPTGRQSDQLFVEIGTTAAIWSCFLYLAWKIWRLSTRLEGRDKGKMKRS